MPDQLIDYELMVAPNGARRSKADHPALPITAEEISHTARACEAAGATSLHLHVRDADGRHSLDVGRYREAIAAVTEKAPRLGVQVTTESAGLFEPAEQLACLEGLIPRAASVGLREITQEIEIAKRTYAFAHEANIDLQHILYTPQCVSEYERLRSDGTIRPSQDRVILVLGLYATGVSGAPEHLFALLDAFEQKPQRWSVCAFGSREHECLWLARSLQGQIRLGFENSLTDRFGNAHEDNAASVHAFLASQYQDPSPSETIP
ncbi:MAG: 3-keto-5-aminohexanoate cleavage protein [Alphaproteobacteria bacterium]